ncbi:hypothetical protein [uncultured Alistipes sp.]|uniref:hypothetical protein n=1 Tax=uncultured Alistipes sp. TaxID=538949 RepID=UPI0025EF02B0|nr:hypothetical protein [uncultured Alistipes sp.]
MKIKSIFTVALAALAFAACNKDNGGGGFAEGTHSLNIKASVPGMGTRADAGTAVGETPAIDNMTLVFVVDGVVDLVHSATVATITTSGETINGITTGSNNSVYVFGGNTAVPINPAVTALTQGDTEATVKAIMYTMANETPGEDPNNVSTRGYASYAVVVGAAASVSLDVVPAISRVEIKTIKANASPTLPADQVHAFDLEGIYINNTFKKIGADYTIYPTVAGDMVNYDSEDTKWVVASTYDARFHDVLSSMTGAATYSATDFWSYYIAPAQKASGANYIGTIINEGGVTAQYLAAPHIVFKLNNVYVGPSSPGTLQVNANTETTSQWYNSNYMFVRVTKYQDGGGNAINYFEPGKVYQIASITFDASNLHSNPVPEPSATHDVVATVLVKDWEGVPTVVDPD